MKNNKCKDKLKICKAMCCGIVPIEIDIYNKLKHKRKKFVIKEIKIDERYIIPLTIPMFLFFICIGRLIPLKFLNCCFLTKDFQCSIYEDRPKICKLFGQIPKMKCKF